MTTTGDVIENPVTGERAVVRVGTVETAGAFGGSTSMFDPGALWSASIGTLLWTSDSPCYGAAWTFGSTERSERLSPAVRSMCRPGVRHDWWNAGDEEALVRVEVRPAARFEAMILNLFGLAQDNKTNARGLPTCCSSRSWCASSAM
jgi:hypothetical protein